MTEMISIKRQELTRRMLAETELARLTEFLKAIDAVRLAKRTLEALGSDEGPEFWALEDEIIVAEDRLLDLATEPGLPTFLQLIQEQLVEIAGEAA